MKDQRIVNYCFLNRRFVKCVAIISMFIDHVGARLTLLHPHLWEDLLVVRSIGRIAFPLFSFQVGFSFDRTKDQVSMVRRFLLLSLLSEIPFDLMTANQFYNPAFQNVMWNFFLAGLFLLLIDRTKQKFSKFFQSVFIFIFFILFFYSSEILSIDYGGVGFSLILIFSFFHGEKWVSAVPFLLFSDLRVHVSLVLSSLMIYFYCDSWLRFKKWESCLYQYFYPMHLFLLFLFLR